MLLLPHQKPIAASKARFKPIRGGRRGGKTTYEVESMSFKAISKAVNAAMEGKNKNVLYIAPTKIQARSIVWEAFKNRLHGIGTFNEVRSEITVPTEDGLKATIHVGGWENRENYRGMPDVYHITFDEVDTMKGFFLAWQQIFRPMLIDTGGSADFIGTPKKENPNLRRLEKQCETDMEWEAFQFTSWDNPQLPREELEKAKKEMDHETYRQEIMAEYVDNAGALFKYDALLDVFTNSVTKEGGKYLIVDIADDGTDKTIFSFWEGLEEYKREGYSRLNTEMIINKTREYASQERIPFSHIAVDAIGVGAGVASSSMLDGIVGYKSSYSAIKTDLDIVRLPNVSYTNAAPLTSDYKNLRSQCIFTLADHVNNHKIASRVTGEQKEAVIEELSTYQDASQGDGKRMATMKEDVKEILGHSPDESDTWIMRMYFVVMGKMLPEQSEDRSRIIQMQQNRFATHRANRSLNSTK